MLVQHMLQLFKLILHQGMTSLVLKQIYAKSLPLSLLLSEHGQKLGTSVASSPQQRRFVARGDRKGGCLHKRGACSSEDGERSGVWVRCRVALAVV